METLSIHAKINYRAHRTGLVNYRSLFGYASPFPTIRYSELAATKNPPATYPSPYAAPSCGGKRHSQYPDPFRKP